MHLEASASIFRNAWSIFFLPASDQISRTGWSGGVLSRDPLMIMSRASAPCCATGVCVSAVFCSLVGVGVLFCDGVCSNLSCMVFNWRRACMASWAWACACLDCESSCSCMRLIVSSYANVVSVAGSSSMMMAFSVDDWYCRRSRSAGQVTPLVADLLTGLPPPLAISQGGGVLRRFASRAPLIAALRSSLPILLRAGSWLALVSIASIAISAVATSV